MGSHGIQLHYYYYSFLFLLLLWGIGRARALSRDDFPAGFTFGAGTSALQVEGAITEDGRKPSIWDYFLRAGKMADKSNADIAADQYHKYKEDVKLMHEMGLDAYRFSIAWPRLIPDGRGAINPKGLQYYNNLIDELISYGIEPHVTIYHFDLPQALQDEYKGLLSPKIIDDYTAYADVCFREFGDRVKNWITVNEPNVESLGGYDQGVLPPERCSYPFGFHSCDEGNSTTEPYIVAYHLLLAHASAVSLYREKYQVTQGGKIGLTLLGLWFEPYTQSPEDIAATKRMIDFHIGWFVHPLVYGTYPDIMRKNVGSRLPSFTEEEANKIKGSFDFIGFNHYLVSYVQSDLSSLSVEMRDYYQDAAVKIPAFTTFSKKGFEGMPVEPWALQKLLEHLKVKYQNPPVVIHENGDGEAVDPKNAGTSYNDEFRANFIQAYMKALILSIKNGSNAQGYFVWSFIDAFEFLFGYSGRYGLVGVDFNDKNRKRYRRYSGDWYSNFLKGNGIKKIASANASAAA